jgi:predicted PurR-regulated permease PerM
MKTPQLMSLTTGTLLRAVAIIIGLAVIWLVRDVILLIFTACMVAGVLYPVAQWATRYRLPKVLVAGFFILLFLAAVVLLGVLLIPLAVHQLNTLTVDYSHMAPWLKSVFDVVQGWTNALTPDNLLTLIISIFGGMAAIVLVLVLSLYLIVEESALRSTFRAIVPDAYHEFGAEVVQLILQRLGGWLRGQLILSLMIGVLYFIALTILHVPYALLLSIVAAVLEFIPYIGPIAAGLPILLVAFTVSPTTAILAAITTLVIHQFEGNVLVPKIMQRAVGLNPIVSIIAFVVGAQLFGIVGAVFAIPLATAGNVLLDAFLRYRREHHLEHT